MSAAFATALVVLAAAVAVSAAWRRTAALLDLGGSLLLVAVGATAAAGWGGGASLDLGTWLGFGPAALRVDRLAGLFLALAGTSGAAVSLAYLEHPPRRFVAGMHGVLLLAMALVLAADQAFLFLLAWEILTVTLYLLAGADRERPEALVAGYLTGAMSKLGGGALLAAFGLLAAQTGTFAFTGWQHAHLGTGARGAAFVLLLIGFGTKVEMIPLQGWSPIGHATAPGASSATLSGIAVNAAFYGLWRLVVATLGPADLWWGEIALVLGGVSALVGILYAIAQDDIKRFLGYSTVEHSGIVLIGFGAALVGQAAHLPKLTAAGLLAATLHLIAHALAKTLAFLGADRAVRAAGTGRLEPLGGLGRLLPRTAAGVGLATLTLAAIPPFGGFVSEWLTFEALLQGFRVESTVARLLMALAAALLALTTGVALLAFAKLYGTVFLGRARSELARVLEPRDPGAGLALLGAVVLVLGPIAPWEIRWVGRGLSSTLGFDLGPEAVSDPLVLGPVYANFSVLAPTWLALVLLAYGVATAVIVRILLRPAVRRAPVWVTGAALRPALVQYSPSGYSNPIRVVLRLAYGYARRLQAQPAGRIGAAPQLRLETTVVPPFERYLYEPLAVGAVWTSRQVRRLQSGKLGTYLLYMLALLVAVLALIPTLH